jgi:hypothetical protein
MISFLTVKLLVLPLCIFAYQYSKQDNPIYRNLHTKNAVRQYWKKSLDEPCLKVLSVYGVPVIIGAASSQVNLEKASAILFKHFDEVENLANTSIGHWNHTLMNKISLCLFFTSIPSRNYLIYAIKGNVWVVGVAKTLEEKDEVLKFVRSFEEVKSVAHYIPIADGSNNGFVVRH